MKRKVTVSTMLLIFIIGWIILLQAIIFDSCAEIKHVEEIPITYEVKKERAVEKEPTLYEIAANEYLEKMSEIETTVEWYLSYKKMLEKYSNELDMPESVYDYFSDEDILLIQRTIETECYGGDFSSKVNVANVILNRIYNDKFDNTAKEVVTSSNQFAYGRTKISDDTKLALEFAFEFEDTTDGCIAFHSNRKKDTFNGWEYQFTDQIGHHFYK